MTPPQVCRRGRICAFGSSVSTQGYGDSSSTSKTNSRDSKRKITLIWRWRIMKAAFSSRSSALAMLLFRLRCCLHSKCPVSVVFSFQWILLPGEMFFMLGLNAKSLCSLLQLQGCCQDNRRKAVTSFRKSTTMKSWDTWKSVPLSPPINTTCHLEISGKVSIYSRGPVISSLLMKWLVFGHFKNSLSSQNFTFTLVTGTSGTGGG